MIASSLPILNVDISNHRRPPLTTVDHRRSSIYPKQNNIEKFDVNHALDCKKGGLVTARHDEIRDELRHLLAHVFSPPRIRCEPMINPAPMRANGTKTHVSSASSVFLNADRGDH